MFTAKFAPALIAAVGFMAVAAPAYADSFESNGRTTEVRHGDLDLTKASDRKILRHRIAVAANAVCTSGDAREEAACRNLAMRHVREPIATAIARAETSGRYADASAVSQGVAGGK